MAKIKNRDLSKKVKHIAKQNIKDECDLLRKEIINVMRNHIVSDLRKD